MPKKINLSIEARTNSSRLPKKVLKKIQGVSMLEFQINMCKKSKLINDIIVATTINKDDDIIEEIAKKNNVNFYRGSELDVLGRVYNAHLNFKSDIIVELTGDNPLQDPEIIDQCIHFFINNNYDFVNNGALDNYRLYPDGMDVAVFSIESLRCAEKHTRTLEEALFKVKDKNFLAKNQYQNSENRFREHVILFLKTSGIFSTFCIMPECQYLERPELSFTVDTFEEYEYVKTVAEKFDNNNFYLKDIISVVDKFNIKKKN